jgi:hypothetical protein
LTRLCEDAKKRTGSREHGAGSWKLLLPAPCFLLPVDISLKLGLKVMELNWSFTTTVWGTKKHVKEMISISKKKRPKSSLKKWEGC